MKTSRPKRLRIKELCSIDGIRDGKRLKSGLYETGKNLSEEERDTLIQPEFAHAIEVLSDAPPQEELATDTGLPQPDAGYLYAQRKELEAVEQRLKSELARKK